MKHGFGRKLLSIVLAVMMLVSLLPTAAFAEELNSYSAESGSVVAENAENTDDVDVTEDENGDENVDDVAGLNDENADDADEGEDEVAPQAVAETDVAKIGDVGYATLEAAIAAATTGDTITLLQDVDLGTSVVSFFNNNSTNLTFDLAGHTIKSAYSKGTTVEASKTGLVIENGTIENTAASASAKTCGTIRVVNGGTTTLENVTVKSTSGTGVLVCALSNPVKVVVNVEAGTEISGGTYGIYLAAPTMKSNSADEAPEITLNVNGGTITGATAGICANSPGGGKKGAVAVGIAAGTVNGVTVVTNNTSFPVETTITGGTIEGDLSSNGANTITISGGEFKGEIKQPGTAAGTITISGGTFATDVSGYLDEDVELVKNSDGSYSVKEPEPTGVAKIGNIGYETLSDAVNNASSGDTIVLLNDVDLGSNYQTINKQLTIDLNGKTISSAASYTIYLKNGADLTVKDSGTNGKITNEHAKTSASTIHIHNSTVKFTLEGGTIESTSGLTTLNSIAIDSVAKANCEVNIKGGSVIVPEAATNGRGIVAMNGMTLNINGGEITGGLYGVTANGGSTVAITSGKISTHSEANYGMYLKGTADVTVDGGEITGIKMDDSGTATEVPNVTLKSGKITGSVNSITNGTITFTVDDNATITFANDTAEKFLPDTVKLVENGDGSYGVAKNISAVAKIGTTEYETLAAAMNAANAGDTITLLKDGTLTGNLDKSVTIEGVEVDGVKPAITTNYWFTASNLTLKNLKLVRNDRLGIQGSNVKFENCEITRSSQTSTYALVDIKSTASNVTFTNCVFDSQGQASCIYARGTDVTLSGCTLKNADFGIYCDGLNGKMTVENCTFTNLPTNVGRADTTPAATFEFKDSNLAGYVGFVADSTVSFTNCKFTKASKSDGSYNADWNQVFTCTDVTFSDCSFTEDYLGKFYVSVDADPTTVVALNGCSVDGDTAAATVAKLASTNMTDTTAANPSGVLAIDATKNTDGKYISGTFVGAQSNIDTNLAEGYVAVKDDNGNYTVAQGTYVAEVNSVKYNDLATAIKATKTGDTVTLLQDVNLGSGKIGFYNSNCENLTFDLGGHKITSAYKDNGTVVASKAGLVIKNGTIENTYTDAKAKDATSAVYVTSGGTTTLENVILISNYSGLYVCPLKNAVTVAVNVEDGTVINGGKYGVKLDAQAGTTQKVPAVTLNVNGGTINGTDAGVHASSAGSGKTGTVNVNIAAGTVSGVIVISNNEKYPLDLAITGGTINGDLTSNSANNITISGGKFNGAITKVGTTGTIAISGGTFASAVPADYCAEGYVPKNNGDGTYTVEEYLPVEVRAIYNVSTESKYATIEEAVANRGENAWIAIVGDYTLDADYTIPEGVGIDVQSGATLTIKESVTLTVAENAKRLGVRDGAKVVNTGTILVCGKTTTTGKVTVFDGGDLDTSKLTAPEGYFIKKNGTNYYAAQALFEVIYTDGTTEQIAEISDAQKTVTQIKLLKDYTGSLNLGNQYCGDFVFDLNGNTISGVEGSSSYVLTITNAKVTIKNGTVKYNGDTDHGAIWAYGNADVTIDNNAIIDGGIGFGIYTGPSKLTVNGTVKTDGSYAIAGNGAETGGNIDSCDITVNNGAVISASNGIAIYHPEKGTVTINGGVISGHTGIEMCAGKLVVSGGTITSNGANMDATGSQNAILDGAAISIINRNYPGGIPVAEITGGTIKATGAGAQALKVYDYTDDKVAEWTDAGQYVNVSGGVFDTEIKPEWCAANYEPVDNGNGTYTVKEFFEARIGNEDYHTLQEAFDVAQPNDLIQLQRDITVTKTLTFDRTYDDIAAILKMNGHTITGDGCRALQIVNGNLKIEGRSVADADSIITSTSIKTNSSVIRVGADGVDATSKQNLSLAVGVTVKTDCSYGITVFGDGVEVLGVENSKVISMAKTNESYDGCAISTLGTDTTTAAVTIKSGAYIEAENTNAIYMPSGNLLVFGDANNYPMITGLTGIYAKSGRVTIKGANIYGTGAAKAYNIYNGNGGVPTGDALVLDSCGYPNGALTVKFEGENDPYFESTYAKPIGSYATEGNTEVTGFVDRGTFNKAIDSKLLAEGYVCVYNAADGNYGVALAADSVAKIGNVYYTTLADAVNAAKDGDTVVLVNDTTTDVTKTEVADRLITTVTFTLDLNGHTITIPAELEPTNNWAGFYINGGTMTVKDSQGNGAIRSGNENTVGTYLFHIAGGDLVIENGTYFAGCTVVNVQKGTATIDGGTFAVYDDDDEVELRGRYLLNCIDANYKDGSAKIIVNGGTFTSFDPRNNAAEGKGTSFVAPGVGVTVNEDGDFVAEPGMVAQMVMGGESVRAYDDLTTALDDAAEKGEKVTVILLQDVDGVKYVEVEDNVVLDLAGYDITNAKMLYVSGRLKDTATEKGIVNAKKYALLGVTSYMPIYDSARGGYSFFFLVMKFTPAADGATFKLDNTGVERANAVKLMLASTNNGSVKAIATFSWENNTKELDVSQSFVFKDAMMAEYLKDAANNGLQISVSGLEKIESDVSMQVKFVTYDENGNEMFALSGPSKVIKAK